MKKLLMVLCALAMILGLGGGFVWTEATAQIVVPVCSAFDTDEDGWVFNPSSEFIWQNTGGNPDGYIRFEDSTTEDGFGYAPGKFLGDWSDLDGTGFISFDHQIFQAGDLDNSGIHSYEINISSGTENVAIWQGKKPEELGSWQSRVAPLTESEWSVTKGSWSALLANVTVMKVRVEMVENGTSPNRDVTGIDNVCLNQRPSIPKIVCICPPEAEPSPPEPGEPVILSIWGDGFGVTQESNSEVLIGSRTMDVISWSDKTIEFRIPQVPTEPCGWFGDRSFIGVRVTVKADGVPSNKKGLKILKPESCQ